jgi:hypothetical protein
LKVALNTKTYNLSNDTYIAGASSLSLIKDAIATINKEVACINWIPRKDESDYVRIRSGAG